MLLELEQAGLVLSVLVLVEQADTMAQVSKKAEDSLSDGVRSVRGERKGVYPFELCSALLPLLFYIVPMSTYWFRATAIGVALV